MEKSFETVEPAEQFQQAFDGMCAVWKVIKQNSVHLEQVTQSHRDGSVPIKRVFEWIGKDEIRGLSLPIDLDAEDARTFREKYRTCWDVFDGLRG